MPLQRVPLNWFVFPDIVHALKINAPEEKVAVAANVLIDIAGTVQTGKQQLLIFNSPFLTLDVAAKIKAMAAIRTKRCSICSPC